MTVRVCIPRVLRRMTGGKRALEAEGTTLREVLLDLARENPPLALHLFDEQGGVRRHIVCIHSSTAIRPGEFAAHRVGPGDEVIITNALAGG